MSATKLFPSASRELNQYKSHRFTLYKVIRAGDEHTAFMNTPHDTPLDLPLAIGKGCDEVQVKPRASGVGEGDPDCKGKTLGKALQYAAPRHEP